MNGTDWADAAIAIAGIVLFGSVIIVVAWQAMATWRARMTGQNTEAYRRLAEQATDAQARTATGLEQVGGDLREVRERTSELERLLKEVQ